MLSFSKKTCNSEKKQRDSEFQFLKKRNCSSDRKNPKRFSNENLKELDQKHIEIFHKISLNQLEFPDFDKENIKPQANSINFEKIIVENDEKKHKINETVNKSSQKFYKNRKNFLEEVTLFDLIKKENERNKRHKAKQFHKLDIN